MVGCGWFVGINVIGLNGWGWGWGWLVVVGVGVGGGWLWRKLFDCVLVFLF